MIKDIKFEPGSVFLVTGGAGFIGSNIAETLIGMGHTVRILDDFSTGLKSNVAGFTDNAEITEGSICDYDTCLRAAEGVHYVLHQAAWGSIPRSMNMPLEYNMINVNGSLNMMQASVKQGVKRFVYASSSSVYGDEKTLPRKEGREGRLLAPYPITKTIVELYAKYYSELYGLKTIGLRYFNVYGRRQNPKSAYAAVIPLFTKLLFEDKQPTINGDGSFSRDFTYIDDAVQANLRACLADDSVTGEVFNIAFGQRITIARIYEIISSLLGKDIKPIFSSLREGDIPHSLADISKARELLGYDPQYGIEEGLKLTADWYRNNL